MTPTGRHTLLDAQGISRALHDMAQAIESFTGDADELILVGILRRGVELAERLAHQLEEGGRATILRGALDITLYRDDLQLVGPKPIVGETRLPTDLEGRVVVIVDDVLYTGRTIRAALDQLADFGRPRRIGLCVLIDRGGRELPIQADIVGKQLEVKPGERVDVLITEVDGRDAVELVTPAAGGAG